MPTDFIDVEYTIYATDFKIRKVLPVVLSTCKLISFDTETRSVYSKDVRGEASDYIKEGHAKDKLHKQAMVVSASSGLSFPSITRTTHFIFGESKSKSHVVICQSDKMEIIIWQMIAEYEGRLLVHNSLFDLKIMYQRIGCLPKDFIDTALMAKCLINHVNIWKAKTSLKELMGSHYSPKWVLMNDYEPKNLKDPDFLMYAAIDGAATFYLWELMQERLGDVKPTGHS